MSQRYTAKDVRAAFERYTDNAARVGFNTDGWTLRTGSGTIGAAYRAHKSEGGRVPGADWGGYIGSTAKEAYTRLQALADAFWDVAEMRAEINTT